MKYHLISGAILLAALVLYLIGIQGGGAALLCVGAALELWFWVRLARGGKRVSTVASDAKA